MISALRILAALALVLVTGGAQAAGEDIEQPLPAASLAELAANAEIIVLAQVRDTDYIFRREFPVEGTAYLRVLIRYKVDQPLDLISVHEQGLHPGECYFPNPSVFEEGRRYLLFLNRDKKVPDRLHGLKQGCALDVLVTSDNGYAVRIPVTGMDISDPLESLSTPLAFADEYAVESDETLSPEDRDSLLEQGWLAPRGDEFIYTHGVELSEIRQLMGSAGVSIDRQQKRLD